MCISAQKTQRPQLSATTGSLHSYFLRGEQEMFPPTSPYIILPYEVNPCKTSIRETLKAFHVWISSTRDFAWKLEAEGTPHPSSGDKRIVPILKQ
jgi:hypothetical protein